MKTCGGEGPLRLFGALETHHLAGEGWEKYPDIQDFHFVYLAQVCDARRHWWQRVGTGKPLCRRWSQGERLVGKSPQIQGAPSLEGVGQDGKKERLPVTWEAKSGAYVSRAFSHTNTAATYDLVVSWPGAGESTRIPKAVVRDTAGFYVMDPHFQADRGPAATFMERSHFFKAWVDFRGHKGRFLLFVGRPGPERKGYVEMIACVVGEEHTYGEQVEFKIPGELWKEWPTGRLLHVMAGRLVEVDARSADGKVQARMATLFWLLGLVTSK